jgi:ABC-type dipeptide/oligopeptide/nickel transport system permease subunit
MSTAEPALETPASSSPPGWRVFLGNPQALMGTILITVLGLAAILAPVLSRQDPNELDPAGIDDAGMPQPPSSQHWLGTDDLGRDVLCRLLYGAQISLTVGVCSVVAATIIGMVVGLYAGYLGGWADVVLMRFTDVMMAIPTLLLALAMAGLLKNGVTYTPPFGLPPLTIKTGLGTILVVIAVVSWTIIARVARSQVLSLKERPFVEAARAIGCSHTRILWRHIFPNVIPAILVLAAMGTAGAIALEAGLSFLGVGVPPPTATWGKMISDGQAYLAVAPWLALPPGIAVVLAVLAFSLLGQGLQDVLDPYHKRRQ